MPEFEPLVVDQFPHFKLPGHGYLSADFISNNAFRNVRDGRWLLFMAGLGEGNVASRHAARVFDELDIPATVLNLPLDSFEPTNLNLETVANELPVALASFLNEDNDRPVDLMGNSQGGAAALMTGSSAPEVFGHIDVIRPLGLNRQALGITSEDPSQAELRQARRKFYFRLGVQNTFRGDQSYVHFTRRPVIDGGNMIGQSEILADVGRSWIARRLKAKLNAGLSLNLAQKAIDLHESGHDTTLWVADRDPLFRLSEILQTLGALGIDGIESGLVVPFPGSHSSIRSSAGTQQLRMVGEEYLDRKVQKAA